MSFGQQPLANALVAPGETGNEAFYEMAPAVCPSCSLFQLVEQPAAENMFNARYPFFTGMSSHMTQHFTALAEDRIAANPSLREDGFVVEIGSNDGTLMSAFARAGIRHLGIEPSESVAKVAQGNGIDTRIGFFDSETAQAVRREHGPADIIIGTNVIAHIGAINEVGTGVAALLKEDGQFVIEAVYLGDMLRNTAFDQLYDEHVFTFSATAVTNVFGRHGLALVDVAPQGVHGGTMRYTLAPAGSREPADAVAALLAEEQTLGLADPATYDGFRQRCESIRDDLAALVRELAAKSGPIVGYGATAKSATVLTYCGLGPDDIAWIQDSTPAKQGMLSPGAHIPIVAPEKFAAEAPDYAVLFAWNHRAEIESRETVWRGKGGKWILYVPEVGIA